MRDQEQIGAAVNQASTPPVIGCQNVTSLILIIKTKLFVGSTESHNFTERQISPVFLTKMTYNLLHPLRQHDERQENNIVGRESKKRYHCI